MKGSVLPNRALDPVALLNLYKKVRVKISSNHENATQPEEVAKTIVKLFQVKSLNLDMLLVAMLLLYWKQEKICHTQSFK